MVNISLIELPFSECETEILLRINFFHSHLGLHVLDQPCPVCFLFELFHSFGKPTSWEFGPAGVHVVGTSCSLAKAFINDSVSHYLSSSLIPWFRLWQRKNLRSRPTKSVNSSRYFFSLQGHFASGLDYVQNLSWLWELEEAPLHVRPRTPWEKVYVAYLQWPA